MLAFICSSTNFEDSQVTLDPSPMSAKMHIKVMRKTEAIEIDRVSYRLESSSNRHGVSGEKGK